MSEKKIGINDGPLITLESTFNPSTVPPIPVYYPTEEEFADFQGCIKMIEKMGAHHVGLCKIVPPSSWKPTIEDQDFIKDLKVVNPILQKCTGSAGIYIQNVQEKKSLNFENFSRVVTDLYESPPCAKTVSFIEHVYWKTIAESSPIYGANVAGSLMKETEKCFNIQKLPSILSETMDEENTKIFGVNTPYLYFGSWRASFPWHVEDSELYSINYVHCGAPKFWYVIPPAYSRKFEAFARELFKSEYAICKNFYRHKCILIKPSILIKAGIVVKKILQKKEEIMITFPYCYHSGFNLGLNVAESTNFATKRWIDYGKKSKFCYCWEDTVRINMDPFVVKYQNEIFDKWIRGMDNSPHPLDIVYTEPMLEHLSKRTDSNCQEEKIIISNGQNLENLDLDSTSGCKSIEENQASNNSTTTPSGEKKIALIYRDLDLNKCINEDSVLKSNCSLKKIDLLTDFHNYLKVKSIEPDSFEAEIEYNKMIGNSHPYCAVCSYLWKPQKFDFIVKQWIKKSNCEDYHRKPIETEPLISETAFSLTMQDHLRPMNLDPKSKVIQCSRCFLSVHLKCYSALEFVDDALEQCQNNSWLCLTCQEEVVYLKRPSCIFCESHGGAIVPLQNTPNEESNQRYWSHIVCAIGSKHARFSLSEKPGLSVKIVETWTGGIKEDMSEIPQSVVQQPVSGASKRKQSLNFWDVQNKTVSLPVSSNLNSESNSNSQPFHSCFICGSTTPSKKLHLMKCSFSKECGKSLTGNDIKSGKSPLSKNKVVCCENFAHLTCIQWAQHLIINADLWPKSFIYICRKHNEEYEKQEHRFLIPVKQGCNVYAWCNLRKRWIFGVVDSLLRNSCYCKVVFLNGEHSSNVPLYKINEYDWDKNGIPNIGQQVQVVCKDELRDAIFDGINIEKWKIRINPKGHSYVKRAEIYHEDEEVPDYILEETKQERTQKKFFKKDDESIDVDNQIIVQKRRCEMPAKIQIAPLKKIKPERHSIQVNQMQVLPRVEKPIDSQNNRKSLPSKSNKNSESDDDYNPRSFTVDGHLKRKSAKRNKDQIADETPMKKSRGRPRIYPREQTNEVIKSPINHQVTGIELESQYLDLPIIVRMDNRDGNDDAKEPSSVERSYLKDLICPIVDSE